MDKGWHKESRRHRLAYFKGRAKSHPWSIHRTSPDNELSDYQQLRSKIIDYRENKARNDPNPEMNRYKHFRLPSNERIKATTLKVAKLRNVKPIEINTKLGMKVVDFHPDSKSMGGQFDTESRVITIDERLMNAADWTIRKGTIAHEYQHSLDESEDSPSAVNNIVRQNLLQDFPKDRVAVGRFDEFTSIANRNKLPIQKGFIKQHSGGQAILFSAGQYAYAKDAVFVSNKQLKKIASAYHRPVDHTEIKGMPYDFVSFRFANLYAKS